MDLMIKHIGTSAIMDLLLRMLTCIEPQQLRQDVLNVGFHDVVSVLLGKKRFGFVHAQFLVLDMDVFHLITEENSTRISHLIHSLSS